MARLPELDPEQAAIHAGAGLHLSPDGQFLYVSNRYESNSLVAYELSSDPPTLLGEYPTGGRTPRSFAIAEAWEFLIVAHREAGGLQAFDLAEDGPLAACAHFELEQSVFLVGLSDGQAPRP